MVSKGGGTRPLWSRTGRELFYYVAPGTIMAVSVPLGTLAWGPPQVVVKGPYPPTANSRHYDVSADGQRFLLLKEAPLPDGEKPLAPADQCGCQLARRAEATCPDEVIAANVTQLTTPAEISNDQSARVYRARPTSSRSVQSGHPPLKPLFSVGDVGAAISMPAAAPSPRDRRHSPSLTGIGTRVAVSPRYSSSCRCSSPPSRPG